MQPPPGRNPKYPLPTLKQVAQGMQFSLENAEDLLGDAEVLYRNERYPRAFALSVLAMEELGKIVVLARVIHVPETDQEGLKAFWKKFRSHTTKFGDAAFWSYASRLHPDLTAAWSELPHVRNQIELMKQVSFYVDFADTGFLLPKTLHSNTKRLKEILDDVKRNIVFHRRNLLSLEETEKALQGLKDAYKELGYSSIKYHDEKPFLQAMERTLEEMSLVDETSITDAEQRKEFRILHSVCKMLKGRLEELTESKIYADPKHVAKGEIIGKSNPRDGNRD